MFARPELHYDFFAARVSYQEEATETFDRQDATVIYFHCVSMKGCVMLGEYIAGGAP
jgi:hypothetical protein